MGYITGTSSLTLFDKVHGIIGILFWQGVTSNIAEDIFWIDVLQAIRVLCWKSLMDGGGNEDRGWNVNKMAG